VDPLAPLKRFNTLSEEKRMVQMKAFPMDTPEPEIPSIPALQTSFKKLISTDLEQNRNTISIGRYESYARAVRRFDYKTHSLVLPDYETLDFYKPLQTTDYSFSTVSWTKLVKEYFPKVYDLNKRVRKQEQFEKIQEYWTVISQLSKKGFNDLAKTDNIVLVGDSPAF
jgi:hypothetical protein